MTDPVVMVVVIMLTVAAIAGLVIYMLSPGREKLLRDDEPALNDARVSSHWAGGGDPSNVVHVDGPFHGHHDGGGSLSS